MSQKGMIFEVHTWKTPLLGVETLFGRTHNADTRIQADIKRTLGTLHQSILGPRRTVELRKNRAWSFSAPLRGAKSQRRRDAPYASKLVVQAGHIDNACVVDHMHKESTGRACKRGASLRPPATLAHDNRIKSE